MTPHTRNAPRLGYMPTPAQELLLKAALLRDDRAIAAWQAWKSQVDLVQDRLDGGTHRLLPLTYLNLKALGVEDEYTQRLKGIHRKAWYQNQINMHVLSKAVQIFDRAGIPTLILKGAPLALLHYKDPGARPMGDVDVLVPNARGEDAVALLHANGWHETAYEQVNQVTPKMMAVRHSWGFSNQDRHGIDLHWHALHMGCFPGADDDFWHGVRPVDVNGAGTHTLCATDMLLHVCVHGGHWNHMPPIRWVADAWTVVNTSQDALDWARLMRMARKFHVVLHLRDMLGYLAGVFGAPVPADVLDALAHEHVSDNDLRVYTKFASQTNNFARKAERHWHNYQRYKQLWREHANATPPAGIVDFMKISMSMRSVWDVLPRVVDRMRERAG